VKVAMSHLLFSAENITVENVGKFSAEHVVQKEKRFLNWATRHHNSYAKHAIMTELEKVNVNCTKKTCFTRL